MTDQSIARLLDIHKGQYVRCMRKIERQLEFYKEDRSDSNSKELREYWEKIKVQQDKIQEYCLILQESENEEVRKLALQDIEETDESFMEIQRRMAKATKPNETERERGPSREEAYIFLNEVDEFHTWLRK